MGQKVNPRIFRVSGGTMKWCCDWYTKTKEEYETNLYEDLMIMEYFERCEVSPYIGDITIDRKSSVPHVTIKASRSVSVFGKKGKSLEQIQKDVFFVIGKKISISVVELKRPDMNPRIMANAISKQIKKRVPYKKAVKTAMESAKRAGAAGVKVIVSGRLNSAEIARSETFMEGSMPLHTIRENIDYYVGESLTTSGMIGIKVWVLSRFVLKS